MFINQAAIRKYVNEQGLQCSKEFCTGLDRFIEIQIASIIREQAPKPKEGIGSTRKKRLMPDHIPWLVPVARD